MAIPLIITTYNQPTYTLNLVNWWNWYTTNPVFILDNNSDNPQQLKYYRLAEALHHNLKIIQFPTNDCAGNLKEFIKTLDYEYYCISDPDIMPHPATPPNFLDVFKKAIEQGYHHAGFDLITEDLPDWTNLRGHILHNEMMAGTEIVQIDGYTGRKAAIDTTFSMYTKNNSGWHAPMNGADWGNAVRLFKAFHLPWYINPLTVNKEMKDYYASCVRHDGGVSAGKNNYRV